jgi:hypothetical protein
MCVISGGHGGSEAGQQLRHASSGGQHGQQVSQGLRHQGKEVVIFIKLVWLQHWGSGMCARTWVEVPYLFTSIYDLLESRVASH